MDGGTIWNVNIDGAVKRCLEIADRPEDVIVDVLMCGYNGIANEPDVSKDAFSNYMRRRQISSYYSGISATYQEMQAYPTVNFRYFFQNMNALGGTDELDFRNSTTWPLQEDGRN
jgi:hypothetical protein